MTTRRTFNAELQKTLTEGVAQAVAGENAPLRDASEHLAEHVVQHLIVKLLHVRLPSPTLVEQNRQLTSANGTCDTKGNIPDIVVKRPDGDPWAVIELKTLLLSDQLSASEVEEDLEKLCSYKRQFPQTAALFMLVGSKDKLFNSQRVVAWESCKISYQKADFSVNKPSRKPIDTDHSAVPYGASRKSDSSVCVYLWEVLRTKNKIVRTPDYQFIVEMFEESLGPGIAE